MAIQNIVRNGNKIDVMFTDKDGRTCLDGHEGTLDVFIYSSE